MEEALGTLGLTAQMVMYSKGKHPLDHPSRTLDELTKAIEHYKRMEGQTPSGIIPWHLLTRPTNRDEIDEAADEEAVELAWVPPSAARRRVQRES